LLLVEYGQEPREYLLPYSLDTETEETAHAPSRARGKSVVVV
jgi:hypothetical protein